MYYESSGALYCHEILTEHEKKVIHHGGQLYMSNVDQAITLWPVSPIHMTDIGLNSSGLDVPR